MKVDISPHEGLGPESYLPDAIKTYWEYDAYWHINQKLCMKRLRNFLQELTRATTCLK